MQVLECPLLTWLTGNTLETSGNGQESFFFFFIVSRSEISKKKVFGCCFFSHCSLAWKACGLVHSVFSYQQEQHDGRERKVV